MRLITIPPHFRPSVSLRNRSRLPKAAGVYYAIDWWKPWKILYVGMSDNLRRRWGGNRHHQLPVLQRHYFVRLHYRVTRTEQQARRLEADEIRRFQPLYNKRRESQTRNLFYLTVDFLADSFWIACGLGILLCFAALLFHL